MPYVFVIMEGTGSGGTPSSSVYAKCLQLFLNAVPHEEEPGPLRHMEGSRCEAVESNRVTTTSCRYKKQGCVQRQMVGKTQALASRGFCWQRWDSLNIQKKDKRSRLSKAGNGGEKMNTS